MTDTIYYTDVIDMSNSEAFNQGFYDRDNGMVYLVFNNGTTVSRHVGQDFDLTAVRSWGNHYHTTLRWLNGDNLGSGNTFAPRPEQVEAADVEAESLTAESDSTDLLTVSIDVNTDAVVELIDRATEAVDELADALNDRFQSFINSWRKN